MTTRLEWIGHTTIEDIFVDKYMDKNIALPI